MTAAESLGKLVVQSIAATTHDFSPENVRRVATEATPLTPWVTEAVIGYVVMAARPDFIEARNAMPDLQHRAATDDARYTRGH